MKTRFLLVLILLVSLLAAKGPYLIVFDASGSMNDYLHDLNATKIEIAKEAANRFIDQSSGEIGIIVFDNCDRGGDINKGGIRLLQDFTTDKTLLKEKINSLKPNSDTPIADALKEASEYLKDTRGQGTIILITDGEETCGGDPVSVAGNIYNESVGKVYVIGYRIGGKAEEKAKAIANAGGGKYYPVENADQLVSALSEITSENEFCCLPAAIILALPFFIALSRRF